MDDDVEESLQGRLAAQALQCRRDGAEDLAKLLDEARDALQRGEQVQWPSARDVGRIGDMSPTASLRVGLDNENDVYVSVWDDSGGGGVEFCCPGGGGGRSSKTRVALIAVMRAMQADNAADPSRDWWARRSQKAGA